jgi:hypothetical protein
MINTIFLLIALLFSTFTPDKGKMVKTKLTKEIIVYLPSDFTPMTDDDLAKKYFTYRKPTAMYTNPERVVDFGLNITDTRWRQSDLPLLQKFYKSGIAKMYTNVNFIQDTISTINKRDFVVFEFISELKDDETNTMQRTSVVKQYSYMQYTVKDNQVHVFNFTCPVQIRSKWQETAREIMQTIKINE